MSTIHDSLNGVFGFQEFKPGHQKVIETLIAGNSAASIFPKGDGKSLCYQLPVLHEQEIGRARRDMTGDFNRVFHAARHPHCIV